MRYAWVNQLVVKGASVSCARPRPRDLLTQIYILRMKTTACASVSQSVSQPAMTMNTREEWDLAILQSGCIPSARQCRLSVSPMLSDTENSAFNVPGHLTNLPRKLEVAACKIQCFH